MIKPLSNNTLVRVDKIFSFIMMIILLFVTYYMYKILNWNMYDNDSAWRIKTFYIAGGVVSVLSALFIQYKQLPKPLTLLLRFAMPVFILTWAVGYLPIIPDSKHADLMINGFRYFALLTAVLGFFRPTLFIPILLYTGLAKSFAAKFYGISISYTDYRPVMDALLYILCGISLYGLLTVFYKKIVTKLHENTSLLFFEIDKSAYYHPLNIVMFLGLSAYLASYYYSGLEKIVLDNAGLYWPNSNTTYTLMLASQLYNLFPISTLIKYCPWLFTLAVVTTPFLNWFSLLFELAALFTLSTKRFAQIVLLSLDLMHFGIFILTGVFFWKWTLFNLALIIALEQFPNKRFPIPIIITSVLFILFIARSAFFVVNLGWFDTRMIDTVQITAITDNKKELLIPTNYFLINSVTYAQNRVGQSHSKGFGTVNTVNEAIQQNQCINPNPKPIKIDDAEFKSFEKQMRYHHQYILTHIDEQGRFNYDLYPHHIWSDPGEFTEFSKLDKRLIKGYRLTLKSYCLDFKDNKLQKQFLGKDTRAMML